MAFIRSTSTASCSLTTAMMVLRVWSRRWNSASVRARSHVLSASMTVVTALRAASRSAAVAPLSACCRRCVDSVSSSTWPRTTCHHSTSEQSAAMLRAAGTSTFNSGLYRGLAASVASCSRSIHHCWERTSASNQYRRWVPEASKRVRRAAVFVAHSNSKVTVMPWSAAIVCQPSSQPPGSFIFSSSDFPLPLVRPVGSAGMAMMYLVRSGWLVRAALTDASSCDLSTAAWLVQYFACHPCSAPPGRVQ
ncbi:hypothetical protein ACFPRL_04910 [Pseudoclavibacter helvolus]